MWFLDTGYLIALFSEKDTFHAQALAMQIRAQRERVRLVTTDAVVLEVGAAFSRVAMRGAGASIMQALILDEGIEVVPVTESLRSKALALFDQHQDKDWSLCDCMSFVLMRERGLDSALTVDHHFVQAGFIALLLQSNLTH
jgi:predicted nucleic acid-binding protein